MGLSITIFLAVYNSQYCNIQTILPNDNLLDITIQQLITLSLYPPQRIIA